jgi:hypothetical protein
LKRAGKRTWRPERVVLATGGDGVVGGATVGVALSAGDSWSTQQPPRHHSTTFYQAPGSRAEQQSPRGGDVGTVTR